LPPAVQSVNTTLRPSFYNFRHLPYNHLLLSGF
jgi:hypothetical protein